MKNQKHSNIRITSKLALALVLAAWLPAHAQSAELTKGKMMMEGKMMERCEEMKEHKQKMMTEMKAQDAELTAQVAQMNSAPDGRKPGLMAAIVTRLVEQRTAMNMHMAKMHEEMMQHMMEHMQAGSESMMQCPMMKGMGDMDEKSTDAHQGHHEEPK